MGYAFDLWVCNELNKLKLLRHVHSMGKINLFHLIMPNCTCLKSCDNSHVH